MLKKKFNVETEKLEGVTGDYSDPVTKYTCGNLSTGVGGNQLFLTAISPVPDQFLPS